MCLQVIEQHLEVGSPLLHCCGCISPLVSVALKTPGYKLLVSSSIFIAHLSPGSLGMWKCAFTSSFQWVPGIHLGWPDVHSKHISSLTHCCGVISLRNSHVSSIKHMQVFCCRYSLNNIFTWYFHCICVYKSSSIHLKYMENVWALFLINVQFAIRCWISLRSPR